MSNVDNILMGGGTGPSVPFAKEGDSHKLIICGEGSEYQARDFTTKEPKFYPSGDPIMCVKYPVVLDDEEKRHTLYIEKREMKTAIRSAVRIGGGTGLRFGDVLEIKRGKDGTPANKSTQTFAARYTVGTEETRTRADEVATRAESGEDGDASWATSADSGTAKPKF